jgi:hypothetical protein
MRHRHYRNICLAQKNTNITEKCLNELFSEKLVNGLGCVNLLPLDASIGRDISLASPTKTLGFKYSCLKAILLTLLYQAIRLL